MRGITNHGYFDRYSGSYRAIKTKCTYLKDRESVYFLRKYDFSLRFQLKLYFILKVTAYIVIFSRKGSGKKMSIRPKSVLFISLGGKCRTPMATGVFQKMVKHNDLEGEWIVDYAALAPIHDGELIDQRVTTILEKHAIRTKDTMRLTVRLATEKDLKDSDFVLCMDELDKRLVKNIGACWVAKVKLFGDYHPTRKCNFEDLFYDIDDSDDEDNDKKFENMYQMLLECSKSFLRRQLKPQEADSEMDDADMPVLERYDSA